MGTVIADSGIGSNEVDVFACEITEPQLKSHYEGIEEIELLTEKELVKWMRKVGLRMVLRFQDMRCIKVGYNGNVTTSI